MKSKMDSIFMEEYAYIHVRRLKFVDRKKIH